MTVFFRSHQITIYRRRRIGSTDRYAMSATFTTHSIDIQPAAPERVSEADGRFGALFSAWVDVDVDIKTGDQLHIVDTGKVYGVRGVQIWQGAGLLDHKELLLEARDA